MRVALMQCEASHAGAAAALVRLEAAAARARAGGATLLVTPEMYTSGYVLGAQAAATAAEPRDGATVRGVAAIAREHAMALVVGFPERGDDGCVYNAAVLADARGRLRACYRKTHLFGDLDREMFSPGAEFAAPVEIDGWRLALGICYDIEFPEFAREMVLAGAEAIVVPTANMLPFEGVATRLVPARAEENGVYVAYANYCGHEPPLEYCGDSCVCAPDGTDAARARRADEALLFADLSKAALREVRERAPYLADRRPALYRRGAGEAPG